MLKLLFIVAVGACAVLAQVDSDAITVTASRSITAPIDHVVFTITAESALNASLDDVNKTLLNAGVSGLTLVGVSNSYGPPPGDVVGLAWTFELRLPMASLKATAGMIENGRMTSKQAYSYTLRSESSPVDPAVVCNPADLLSDAKGLARKMASAAGVTLGPVLAMSDASAEKTAPVTTVFSIPTPTPFPGYIIPISRVSIGSFLLGFPSGFSNLSIPESPACTLTVKFRLLRY